MNARQNSATVSRFSRSGLFKNVLLLLTAFLLASPASLFAIMEDYPPFTKKESKPPAISFEDLPDDHREGDWAVKTYEDGSESLMPKATDVYYKGKLIWASESEENQRTWNTRTQYAGKADLDGNGVEDIVILTGNTGNTLCIYMNTVTIFLREADGRYNILRMETMSDDAKLDFLDFNKDGKTEFLRCDLVSDIESLDGKQHTYWLYTIHEIKGGRFVMNNSLRDGFPKFIWYTRKPNDKPTNKIAGSVKKKYVEQASFGYKPYGS